MGRPEPFVVLVPDRFGGMTFCAHRASDEGALLLFGVKVYGRRDDEHRDEQGKDDEMLVIAYSHDSPAPVELIFHILWRQSRNNRADKQRKTSRARVQIPHLIMHDDGSCIDIRH